MYWQGKVGQWRNVLTGENGAMAEFTDRGQWSNGGMYW